MVTDLREILTHIDPTLTDYGEWIAVGMALKDEGYTAADWDAWSARDTARYHAGECVRKWATFAGSDKPVTGGTIVELARRQGWQPSGTALTWDATIGGGMVEKQLSAADPQQLITYLRTLFKPNERVGYVNAAQDKDGRWVPRNKGCYDRTAGELIAALEGCNGDIGAVLGDTDPAAGAWIRFNPLDGEGVKNTNVAAFRYALVESDKMDISGQEDLIRSLELPTAALVHSGGKSLHAIVHIDAADADEYRERVDYLYGVLKSHGAELDTQNKNPSRLSRMPGVMRGDRRQELIAVNIGKRDFNEWREYIEGISDDLPDTVSLADVWDNLPPLAPSLIDGVLRQGHKMLVAGPSKAGKSYALIELCIAIAEGRKWLGWQCTQGRVMYVNLELDHASCFHRFRDVYDALGIPPDHLQNIDIWNLRGRSVPMDKLAPRLIRRAAKLNCAAVIIDPIYKVITGDENSADQMAYFCNQFDRVCTELGCAVIYCHHHSKGYQGAKRSMDRASGSGVFARDPDALIDLVELDVTEDLMKQQSNNAVAAACTAAMKAHFIDWETKLSQDAQCSETAALAVCREHMTREDYATLLDDIAIIRERVKHKTAWRVEGTLREFARFDPVNVWFDYPVHTKGGDELRDIAPGEENTKNEFVKRGADYKQKEKKSNWQTIENGFEILNENGSVTIAALMEYSGLSRNTIINWAEHQTEYMKGEKGVITRVDT